MLYITSGAQANLLHALRVNCVTFSLQEQAEIMRSVQDLERACARMRKLLKEI